MSVGTDTILAGVAAAAATLFAIDLLRDLRRNGMRAHTAAYAAGIGMFAVASWALFVGVGFGWAAGCAAGSTSCGPVYRAFFLFGAVLNIPFLALGSMHLVVGRRSGTAMFLAVGALAAISTTLVTTTRFDHALPETGIPAEIFPPITDGLGPRLLAAISGGTAALILVVLALVSIIRFRRTRPRIAVGSALIVAGTFAASFGGTNLGVLGEAATFAASLALAVTLIWWGYRVTRSPGRAVDGPGSIVVVGPTSDIANRTHAELVLGSLEEAGFHVMCPPRDIEDWGQVGYSPAETMRQTVGAIESADALVIDLAFGWVGLLEAGYAYARGVPVVVATPEGTAAPRALRGIATTETYYTVPSDIVEKVRYLLTVKSP